MSHSTYPENGLKFRKTLKHILFSYFKGETLFVGFNISTSSQGVQLSNLKLMKTHIILCDTFLEST